MVNEWCCRILEWERGLEAINLTRGELESLPSPAAMSVDLPGSRFLNLGRPSPPATYWPWSVCLFFNFHTLWCSVLMAFTLLPLIYFYFQACTFSENPAPGSIRYQTHRPYIKSGHKSRTYISINVSAAFRKHVFVKKIFLFKKNVLETLTAIHHTRRHRGIKGLEEALLIPHHLGDVKLLDQKYTTLRLFCCKHTNNKQTSLLVECQLMQC